MLTIFISYRRADSQAITGRMYDRLVEVFDKDSVFKDVDRIPPGSTFVAVLEEALDRCSVLLVIIGRRWVNIQNADGEQRLYKPDDFVRMEVEKGLQRDDMLVVPVLVDNAPVPDADDLPQSLHSLPLLQVVNIRHDPDFHRDMNRLIQFLSDFHEQQVDAQPEDRRRTRSNTGRVFTGLTVAITLIGLAALFFIVVNGNFIQRFSSADDGQTSTQIAETFSNQTREAQTTQANSPVQQSVTTEETIALATATRRPTDADTGGRIEHVVGEGETLLSIAIAYDVSMDEIRELNDMEVEAVGLYPVSLQVGQVLLIREAGNALPTETPQPTPDTDTDSGGINTAASGLIAITSFEIGEGCMIEFYDVDSGALASDVSLCDNDDLANNTSVQWSNNGNSVVLWNDNRDVYLSPDGHYETGIIVTDMMYRRFSPDGSQVVGTRDGNIVIRDLNEPGDSQIELDFTASHPAWTPDGSQIIFRGTPVSGTGLFLMDVASGEVNRLTVGHHYCPRFSPDGNQIVYVFSRAMGSTPSSVYVMDADGTNQRKLTNISTWQSCADWSPNGAWITFTGRESFETGDEHLFIIRADGTDIRGLTTEARRYGNPAWQP